MLVLLLPVVVVLSLLAVSVDAFVVAVVVENDIVYAVRSESPTAAVARV